MSLLTPKFVYRKYETDGVPDSGKHKPDKSEVVQLLDQLFGVSRGGWVVAPTIADLGEPENETDGGVVLSGAGAGYYARVEGEWERQRGFPDTLARLRITGGTANAIQASTAAGVDPGAVVSFLIDPALVNTTAVTISINGGAYVPARRVDGEEYEPGEFTGRISFSVEEDGWLRATTADAGVISYLVAQAVAVAPGTWAALRDETINAADDGRATLSATNAAKDLAVAAKVQAEAAVDIALLSAGIFASTSAGLAATSTGRYFSVPSTEDDEFLILYRHDSGPSAVQVKHYRIADPAATDGEASAGRARDRAMNPANTSAALDVRGFKRRQANGWVWGVLDSAKKLALGLRVDGRTFARLTEDSEVPGAFSALNYARLSSYAYAIREAATGKMSELSIMRDGKFPDRVAGRFSGMAYDIRTMVKDSRRLPGNGISDEMSDMLSEAFVLANERAENSGVPIQIYVPAGIFRLTAAIPQLTKVGVGGAGRRATVFKPVGSISAFQHRIESGYVGPDHDDCYFTDLTVDGALQTGTSDVPQIKGFYIQRMVRARFERVDVMNCGATGFGVDFLTDTYFIDCWAKNNGRLRRALNQDRVNTGAGFGFATGMNEEESITVIGGGSLGNWTHGLFSERAHNRLSSLPGKANGWNSRGLKVIGFYAEGNNIGIYDAGSTGMQVVGGQLTGNDLAGYAAGGNSASPGGGEQAELTNCSITKNGLSPMTGSIGGGVVIREASGLAPTINGGRISKNAHGVVVADWTEDTTPYSVAIGAGLTITGGAEITENKGAGVLLKTATPIKDLAITPGVRIYNNGTDTGAIARDGIHIDAPLADPFISMIRSKDTRSSGKTQQRGINITAAATLANPKIKDNGLAGNAVAGLTNAGTVTGTSDISGNLET